MAATEKDRLTNAIMALVVGTVVLLSRDFIDLMLDSMSTWVGGWMKGWSGPGGVLELLFRLLVIIVLAIFTGITLLVLWILSGLNHIYVMPVLAALICYATPWPFRLGFLNPMPYLASGSRWVWDMFVISSYGEYLRRGRGKSVVFIILPLVGLVALGVGAVGLLSGKAEGIHLTVPSLASLSIMPGGRTLHVVRAVDTHLKAGVQLRKVVLGREETKLVVRFWTTYPPWTPKLSISRRASLSRKSYLIDDQGNRYSAVGSEDMDFGRAYDLVIREDRFGTLVFEPLRPQAEYFDLHFHSLETGEDWVAKGIKVR